MRVRAIVLVLLFAVAICGSADAARRFGVSHRAVCGSTSRGFAHCNADVATNASGAALQATTPQGYGPADLQSAYGLAALAASNGADQSVAVVDAYDDPNAEADLAVYRAQYGLPACTTANGCFRKVDQRGGTSYPAVDSSWAEEVSLDLDVVSATCPRCHILLVESDSDYLDDLGAAVNRAALLGATQISNSYGGDEWAGETSLEYLYNHTGVAVTASSGDWGYGVEYPAASRYVTAVGGTSLSHTSSNGRGWSETAWSGAGAGCSAYIAKPAWQTDSPCAARAVTDVSAVADPNTGVAIYDSLPSPDGSGWMVFGGTSAAAPLVAGYDALTGAAAASPQYAYLHAADYFDVTSGDDGTCTWTYLCVAGPGYDGPTGLGTPNGSPSPAGGGGNDGGSGSNPPDAGGTATAPPPAGNGGGSTGTTPPPLPPVTPPQPVTTAGAPLRIVLSVRARRIRAALERGLAAAISCSRACDVRATLVLAPTQARRLHLRAAAFTIARASGHSRGGGSRMSLHLRFTAQARRALSRQRAVRLALNVTGVPDDGPAISTNRGLVLHR